MKINVSNKQSIATELNRVQGRCSARLITHDDMVEYIREVEDRLLDLSIAKKEWRDMEFNISIHRGKFAACYRLTAEGTTFNIKRFASGWFITRLWRASVDSTAKKIVPMLETTEKIKSLMQF